MLVTILKQIHPATTDLRPVQNLHAWGGGGGGVRIQQVQCEQTHYPRTLRTMFCNVTMQRYLRVSHIEHCNKVHIDYF